MALDAAYDNVGKRTNQTVNIKLLRPRLKRAKIDNFMQRNKKHALNQQIKQKIRL
jgi:hypothetical protein